MSLWLCRQESVTHPYYIEALGIHIYSSQELSYVIYNNPLLVLDEFVSEQLLTFLRDELNQGFLALKLERWLKSGESPDDALVVILQECDYYTTVEVAKFRQMIANLRKLHPADFGKRKADELFDLRQYGKALKLYREMLQMPPDQVADEAYFGRIWQNIGSCHARRFQLEEALDAYEKAYDKTADQKVLEQIYMLSLLDSRLVLKSRFQLLVNDESKAQWEQMLTDAREKAAASPEMERLERLFMKDPVKRQAGMSQLLQQWKREYRGMV